ncbi:unnamed protein product [Phaeothamnion confervicola]
MMRACLVVACSLTLTAAFTTTSIPQRRRYFSTTRASSDLQQGEAPSVPVDAENVGLTAQERLARLLGQSISQADAAARAKEAEEAAQRQKRRNAGIAVGSILSSAALFFFQHSGVAAAGPNPVAVLRTMERDGITLSAALSNGKPTVVDFYAEWCENCKDLAPTMGALEKAYSGEVNFVVIDGDNRQNYDLVGTFRVDGIPHLAMVTAEGNVETALIGNVPRKLLEADLDALLQHKPLPIQGYDAFAGQDHNIHAMLGSD